MRILSSRDFHTSLRLSIALAGTFLPGAALAQGAAPAFFLNPQPPLLVAPDPKFVGTTPMQVPAPIAPLQASPVSGSVTGLAQGSVLAAPVQVALALKYSNEPKIVPTAHVVPQFPGSPLPTRNPFQPASGIVMGPPVFNATYQPDVVNEPMVDTSHPPFQMPTH